MYVHILHHCRFASASGSRVNRRGHYMCCPARIAQIKIICTQQLCVYVCVGNLNTLINVITHAFHYML